jgi:hypothetical protein
MIYPGFNSKKWVHIVKAKQKPDLAGSFQAKIHCFFLMVSEVFISQIHEIYPSHRWIHMGLWVVGQKTSVGSQQWCASNDPVATGEAGKMCFGSLIFFRAARGCQICLKPMLTCSDIACLATTNIICDILAPRPNTKPLTWTRYSNRASRNLMVWLKPHLGEISNSHRVPTLLPLLLYDHRKGRVFHWAGMVWLQIVVQFHHISPTKLSVFPAQASYCKGKLEHCVQYSNYDSVDCQRGTILAALPK